MQPALWLIALATRAGGAGDEHCDASGYCEQPLPERQMGDADVHEVRLSHVFVRIIVHARVHVWGAVICHSASDESFSIAA